MAEELDRDRPLFNDEVAVQVKFPDHEKTLALTVRVLQGSRLAPVGSGGGQREGVLHIEVTDELDPFFLYTLQVRAFLKEVAAFSSVCSKNKRRSIFFEFQTAGGVQERERERARYCVLHHCTQLPRQYIHP